MAFQNLPRWVTGCAISLAAVVVLVLFFAFAGYWWLVTPGPQVDSEWFIGHETVGVFHLDRPFEDEGVREFVTDLIHLMNQRERQTVEREVPSLGGVLNFFGSNRDDIARELEAEAPRQVTLILESRDPSGEPFPAAIVNFARYPRALRLGIRLYRWLSDEGSTHRGFDLVPFNEGVITFVENTLVWSRDREGIIRILERLETIPSAEAAEHPAGEAFADPQWDLFGSIDGRGGGLNYLLELSEGFKRTGYPGPEEFPAELWKSAERIELGLDIRPGDSALIGFKLQCASSNHCQQWQRHLESSFERLTREADLPLERYHLETGTGVVHGELEFVHLRSFVANRWSNRREHTNQ